ncbi:MAG: sigma-70 family RNA polymerase sigma factor [Candidatus Faecousia sp.]|nr:sigma-70 family RNA polymerase sigma factor [Candidatus Faecousia sp.]
MSNEELVAAIRAGENRMGELWEQVKGLVAWKASHIMTALDLRGSPCGVEFDDLYQSGYPALVTAVDSYEPESGAFSTWFMYHLKTAFSEATGYRTKSGQNEPVNNALSLDEPLTDEADSGLFGDLIPDPKAAATMLSIEEKLWREQLHEALEAALAALPEQNADVLRLRYYQGLTLAETGERKGTTAERVRQMENKAIRQLQKPGVACHLRPFYDFDFYCGTGLGAFQRAGMSIQERYLVIEEERKEREEQRRKEREARRQKEIFQSENAQAMQRAEARVAAMTPEEKQMLLAAYGYA